MPKIKARVFALIRWLALLLLFGIAQAQVPKFDYPSYMGGSGDESAYAVATDSTGAIYIAGFTTSSDLPVVNPLQRYYAAGTGDLFVAKLKPNGSGFAYLTYIGGTGGEGDAGYVGGIAVDSQGNAYVAGVTRSADFPTTPGAFQPNIGSTFVCDSDPNAGLCGDAFVLKLSPTGDHLVYSTFIGGSDYDDAKAIAIDSTGAAYITGMTASPDFPTTPGAFQIHFRDVDAYIAKLSPDGSQLLYSTLIGGNGFDAGMAIAVDSAGRAYVAGTTQAPDFSLKRALHAQFGEPWDAFVLRLNATGSDLDFSTYLGGQDTDQAFGIALDSNENIYIAGSTSSVDFPVRNAFQPFFGGTDTNGFVTKLASDGSSILYSTFLGGGDRAAKLNAITVDAACNAYVAGQGGSDFPIVSSIQSHGGGSDVVVAKLSRDGSKLLYSTFIGGSGFDVANGIALDVLGRVVIAGQASSPDFPLGANSPQSVLSGPSDAFVMRLIESASVGPAFSAPKTVPLGSAYVGQWSVSGTITIANVGASQLAFSNIVPSSNVRVTSSCSTVPSDTSCSLAAQLLTVASGDQSGTITFYDNASDSPQTITVRATAATGGDLELSSLVTGASFNYYGKPAIPVAATIINHGPYDATNVSVISTSSASSANCDPCYVGNIRAGKSVVLRFNFVPSSYGMLPITAAIEPDDSTPDLNLANNRLTINIANPRYSITPTQLSFGNQPIGSASLAQRIVFTSLDQQPLALSISSSGDYTAVLSCDAGALRCYADATFKPATAGNGTGILTVTESVANTTEAIPLSGNGVLAPHARLSDHFATFIAGVSPTPTVAHAITLTNDGSSPLFLVSIGVSGQFSQTNRCPASLMPNEACSVLINFVPVSAGMATGFLTISDNTASRVEIVSLLGIGIPLSTLVRPSRSSPTPDSTASVTSLTSTQPSRPNLQDPAPILSAKPISPQKAWAVRRQSNAP